MGVFWNRGFARTTWPCKHKRFEGLRDTLKRLLGPLLTILLIAGVGIAIYVSMQDQQRIETTATAPLPEPTPEPIEIAVVVALPAEPWVTSAAATYNTGSP